MTVTLTLTADQVGAPLGERATLLQVSTAFCAPCRTAHRVLARVADAVPGVRHVDVDVADAPALAATLEVTATPTVVVLDAAGAVVVRAQGVPTSSQVLGALALAVPEAEAPSGRSVGGTPTRGATAAAPSARTAVRANASTNGPASA
ncbi:MAG: thioredoxin family protein [Cellulomonas sp.]|nr:thioredoxin family protein [Cellulomonas sp.]